MPSKERHLAQAGRNEAFATELLAAGAHPDWVPVIAFYSAWHYVQAYFDTQPGISHRMGHDAVQTYVSTLSPLRPIQQHYFRLFNECNKARYQIVTVREAVARDWLDNDLRAIRRTILPLV